MYAKLVKRSFARFLGGTESDDVTNNLFRALL